MLETALKTLDSSWSTRLYGAAFNAVIEEINHFLCEENHSNYAIFPPVDQVFAALNMTPFEKVRVVILGQDPYPLPGHAMGLSFSVKEGVRPLPVSLRNIFDERARDVGVPNTGNGDLTNWARQGVLLLNTVLTVRGGKIGSHRGKGWEHITDMIINRLLEEKKGLVFIIWGADAIRVMRTKRGLNNHHHIVSSHPSYFSYQKPCQDFPPFEGSRPFSRTNIYFHSQGQDPIAW